MCVTPVIIVYANSVYFLQEYKEKSTKGGIDGGTEGGKYVSHPRSSSVKYIQSVLFIVIKHFFSFYYIVS